MHFLRPRDVPYRPRGIRLIMLVDILKKLYGRKEKQFAEQQKVYKKIPFFGILEEGEILAQGHLI